MTKNILAIIAAVIIIAGAFYITRFEGDDNEKGEEQNEENSGNGNEQEGEQIEVSEEFIACLKDAGVVIYGSEWCGFCAQLVDSLGGKELVEPIYVECTVEEARCSEEMEGGGVPEIQIEGKLFKTGVIPVQLLADETGCEL